MRRRLAMAVCTTAVGLAGLVLVLPDARATVYPPPTDDTTATTSTTTTSTTTTTTTVRTIPATIPVTLPSTVPVSGAGTNPVELTTTTVLVEPVTAAAATTTTAAAGAVTIAGGNLPTTGSDINRPVTIAALLLAVGIAALVAARRRVLHRR